MTKNSPVALWTGLALMVLGLVIGAVMLTRQRAQLEAVPTVAARNASADATSDNGQRKLARVDDTTLYLAYSAPNDGVEQAHVSTSLDGGQTWKPEIVLGQPGIWSDLPALASGSNGRLDATWVDYTSVGHVWYSSMQNGEWQTFQKISPGPHYAGFPVIAIDGTTPNVAWYSAPPSEETQHGSEYEIRHTMLDGGEWTEPELLSTSSQDALNPTMALGTSGVLRVAWFQDTIDVYGIHVSSLEDDGWTTPDLLSTPEQTATGVSIEVDSVGRSHAVWEQTADGAIGVAYAMQIGRSWQSMEILASRGARDPAVAVDGEDRVYVLWSQEGQIVGRVMDGGWSDPVDLGQGTNPTSLSGETVLAAWTRPAAGSHEVVTSPLRLVSSSPGQDLAAWALAVVALASGALLVWRGKAQALAPASLRTERTSGK